MPSTSMQALVFDGPAEDATRTRVAVLPTPAPGPGQVLIRVSHAGVNFKDVMMRRGDRGYVGSWPVVPGLEVAGSIAAVGEGVDGFEAGDRVVALTNTGGLAEYAVARGDLTARVPEGVPSAVAAVVPGVWSTAQLLLHEAARARRGDIIVVHSASGAVGAAVAALARRIPDVTLLGVVGSPARLDGARRIGYEDAFVRDDRLAEMIRARLDGRGADIVLDPQGTGWLDADLKVLSPTGRIVLFGNASGHEFRPLPTSALYAANASVGGFSVAALSASAPRLVKSAIETVLDLIVDGVLAPDPSVTTGLERAAGLQQRLADGVADAKHVIAIAD